MICFAHTRDSFGRLVVQARFRRDGVNREGGGFRVHVVWHYVGGNLQAADAGAGNRRCAGSDRRGVGVVSVKHVRGSISRIGSPTRKNDGVGGGARAVAAIENAVHFGEVGWQSSSQSLSLGDHAALQGAWTISGSRHQQLHVDLIYRSRAVQVAFILNGCGAISDEPARNVCVTHTSGGSVDQSRRRKADIVNVADHLVDEVASFLDGIHLPILRSVATHHLRDAIDSHAQDDHEQAKGDNHLEQGESSFVQSGAMFGGE